METNSRRVSFDYSRVELKDNDILIGFVPLQLIHPIQNPIHNYPLTSFTKTYTLNLNPFINTNIIKTNLKHENSSIWISIIVIQKISTNKEFEGEADKGTIPLSDRATSLDIPSESNLNSEGSGMEDVDAEGVRTLFHL